MAEQNKNNSLVEVEDNDKAELAETCTTATTANEISSAATHFEEEPPTADNPHSESENVAVVTPQIPEGPVQPENTDELVKQNKNENEAEAAVVSPTESTSKLEIADASKATATTETTSATASAAPEADNIRVVIAKYLSMAVKEKESKKPSVLLKDKYICDFLVLALMNDSAKVVVSAMEVFEVLVSSRRNHSTLQTLPYFMPMLDKISKSTKLPPETKRDAHQIMRILKETKHALVEQSTSARNTEDNTGQKSTMAKPNTNATSTLTRRKQQSGREAIFVLRPGVLQMHYNRTNIEQHLIRVPGIISLTYNLAKNHCIVRGKRHVASELFGVTIANLGFEVSLLCRNETQEESLVPITPDLKELSSKENLPGYLPEDFEEIQGPVADNALCSKDLTNPDNNKEGSILSSAMKFVKNSFYW